MNEVECLQVEVDKKLALLVSEKRCRCASKRNYIFITLSGESGEAECRIERVGCPCERDDSSNGTDVFDTERKKHAVTLSIIPNSKYVNKLAGI